MYIAITRIHSDLAREGEGEGKDPDLFLLSLSLSG